MSVRVLYIVKEQAFVAQPRIWELVVPWTRGPVDPWTRGPVDPELVDPELVVPELVVPELLESKKILRASRGWNLIIESNRID